MGEKRGFHPTTHTDIPNVCVYENQIQQSAASISTVQVPPLIWAVNMGANLSPALCTPL